MSLLRQLRSGLRGLARRDAVDRELDDEVAHYLEQATEAHMRAGLSRADAERAARREFGGVDAAKEQVRAGAWESVLTTAWADARHALRGLRRNPAFTIVAVLTLALGIGATTSMFSLVNAVMLRPLPYRDGSRLVQIWTDDVRRGLNQERTSFRTIADWRSAQRTLDDIAYYNVGRATFVEGEQERTRAAFVSGNLFALLGVRPALGRVIVMADEAGAEPVAVISHTAWQRRFGGDPAVIGRAITVDTGAKDGAGVLRVAGVMPADFFFPDRQTELWTPATTYWRFERERDERFVDWARRWIAIGRMKAGVSLAEVRSDFAGIGRRLESVHRSDVPDFPGFTTNVTRLLDSVAGRDVQSALWLLLGAVMLVLLVACANVANLLLARDTTREHEFTLRRALGASRGRLLRQLLVESGVLAFISCLLGIALAFWGTRVLAVVASARLPRMEEVGVDTRVLIFAVAAALLAGIVFGVLPALRVSGAEPGDVLREGRVIGRHPGRARSLLVVAECALSIVLLVGAGLLLRSLARVQAVDPGFDPNDVLAVRMQFPAEAQPDESDDAAAAGTQVRARNREQALSELATRIAEIPGVEAVGFVDDLFVTGRGNTSITIPGRDDAAVGELNDGAVTPGFFAALRVPLRRGRHLTRADALTKIRALWPASVANGSATAIAEPVVVNESFARRYFPGEDPIGRRFCTDPLGKTYWYEIVGVAADMHRQGLERSTIPEYFGPYIPSPSGRTDLLVRAATEPLALAPIVSPIITAAFPGALIVDASTVDRQLDNFGARRVFQAGLLASFAGLALLLAALGIYGVVHYTMAERTREIGVRVALGAAQQDVLRMVIIHGMRLPLAGIAVGLGVSLALTRVMRGLLFGTSPTDPLTYAAVALALAGVAACACYAPARRASRVDPMVALRRE